MTDRPVLFSGPMIRALLQGRKTQTRRVIKVPTWTNREPHEFFQDEDGIWQTIATKTGCLSNLKFPQIGDRLWVREAWRTEIGFNHWPPRGLCPGGVGIGFEADGLDYSWGKLRPGMFMPRWASRLTLMVADARVQRLQEIDETDSIAEGCRSFFDEDDPRIHTGPNGTELEMMPLKGPRDDFRELWDGLNARRGNGWDENPWVAAISFTAHPNNIDQVAE